MVRLYTWPTAVKCQVYVSFHHPQGVCRVRVEAQGSPTMHNCVQSFAIKNTEIAMKIGKTSLSCRSHERPVPLTCVQCRERKKKHAASAERSVLRGGRRWLSLARDQQTPAGSAWQSRSTSESAPVAPPAAPASCAPSRLRSASNHGGTRGVCV